MQSNNTNTAKTLFRKKKKFDPGENARITYRYFDHLRHAHRLSESSIRLAANAIDDFCKFVGGKDFRLVTLQNIRDYKEDLFTRVSTRTDMKLSLSAVRGKLNLLNKTYIWLREQKGYRSHITFEHAAYFKIPLNDERRSRARSRRPIPTPAHIRMAIECTPTDTDQGWRDRALIAFLFLTGIRIDAVASLRLCHIDLVERVVYQDARDVRTKFRKSILTNFFPVGLDIEAIVVEWINYLRTVKKFGPNDPLFPAISIRHNPETRILEAGDLSNTLLLFPNALRKSLKEAWERAGLPYHNPHSFRKTVTLLGERLCQTPEEFKVWSQSLGHDHVSTTFTSYGTVSDDRQSIVFAKLHQRVESGESGDDFD